MCITTLTTDLVTKRCNLQGIQYYYVVSIQLTDS